MSNAQDAPQPAKTVWAWAVATFFGAGLWKPGPGTAGSVAATLIWLLAGRLTWTSLGTTAMLSTRQFAWITAGAAFLLFIIAVPASTIVARECGRKDPQLVVADEAVGQWITLIAAPANWRFALVGLLLFRVFDIIKPPPIRSMEQLPGGWGIMLDDVGAGVLALLCLQFIRHWFW